jgi:hypothetical protein
MLIDTKVLLFELFCVCDQLENVDKGVGFVGCFGCVVAAEHGILRTFEPMVSADNVAGWLLSGIDELIDNFRRMEGDVHYGFKFEY